MAYKKNFVIGAKLLASEMTENFTILEPIDEAGAIAPAYLTCGTAGSVSAFEAISDGAFKITINSEEYEVDGMDFSPVLTSQFNSLLASDAGQSQGFGGAEWCANTFTTGAGVTNIKKVTLKIRKNATNTGDIVLSIRAVSGSLPTGADIESKTVSVPSSGAHPVGVEVEIPFEFTSPVTVSPSTTYAVVWRCTGSVYYTAQLVSSSGVQSYSTNSGSSWTAHGGNLDIKMKVESANATIVDHDDTAGIIQTAIRAKTGGDETVVYDTDHFIISSGINSAESNISVLSAPTAGTDIGGASYINGATNGAVTPRLDSSGKVVKTGADGVISNSLMDAVNAYSAGDQANWTGDNNASAFSVFQTLADGANDGAIGITIDGVDYDNIPVNLVDVEGTATAKLSQTTLTGNQSFSSSMGQAFTIPTGVVKITKIRMNNFNQAGITWELRTGGAWSGGTLLDSGTVDGSSTWFDIPFNSEIDVTPGNQYILRLTNFTGTGSYGFTGALGGDIYINGTPNTNWDAMMEVFGKSAVAITANSQVATLLQTAIRAITSGTETVEFLTEANKFKVTSGTTGYGSEVSNPRTPTSGTDISGAGATPYLDLANGIQDTTPSSANKVVKTGTGGKIDGTLLVNDGTYQSRSNNVNYQAEENGFLIVTTSGAGEIYVYVGDSPSPTTVITRARDSVSGYTDSATVPIKKGKYYRCTFNTGLGWAYWLPWN